MFYANVVNMRSDKQKAFELRKKGKSFNEIHKELGVPKSTLSGWLQKKKWSKKITERNLKIARIEHRIRIKNLNKIRGEKLKKEYEIARQEAMTEFNQFKKDPLFIFAIAAYWGEGDKRSKHLVRITNTDPGMISIFFKFLIEICNFPENRIKGALFIYPDLNEEECRIFWSKETGLQHFTKTMILPSKHKTRRLPYGTCTLVVSSRYLKEKMLIWLDLLPGFILKSGM